MDSDASVEMESVVKVGSIAIVVLAIGLPLLPLPETVVPVGSDLKTRHLVTMASKWGRVAAIVGVVLFVEGRSLSSIGLRGLRWKDLLIGIGTLIGLLVVNSVLQSVLSALGIDVGAGEVLLRMAEMSFVFNAAVAVTAGVTEEVLYRGAAIERLEALTGHVSVAAILPAAVFVGGHLPEWGLGSGIVQLGYVGVFTGVYLRFRRLGPVIFAHVLLDSIGLLVYPMLR
jgi:membrane protease YdiL (CAAX protease family)